MYDNNDTTGRATSLKHDNTMPKAWWKAWQKVQRQKECTHQEQGLAAAAEVAVKMGCAYPVWAGVVTKPWIWMLSWGNIYETQIIKFIRKHRKILMTQTQQMWKTRTLTRDEIKTQQNQQIFTKYSTAKLSREAIKQGVWNLGNHPTNYLGNRKRKWIVEQTPKRQKRWNQNTITNLPGYTRTLVEKTPRPVTGEKLKEQLRANKYLPQTKMEYFFEQQERQHKRKTEQTRTSQKVKKITKKQKQIREDELAAQHRNAWTRWQTTGTMKRKEVPMRTQGDDYPEPIMNNHVRELIQRCRGMILAVHGDGACWYRAIAKTMRQNPQQTLQNMREGVRKHALQRNRTDGVFVTSLDEEDEQSITAKVHHYTNRMRIQEGIAIPFQPQQWWGGNREMELWVWHNKCNAIWIHTHESVITTYQHVDNRVTSGTRHAVEQLQEKWNIIEEAGRDCQTIILLYSGNHFTAVLTEHAPTRREPRPNKKQKVMTNRRTTTRKRQETHSPRQGKKSKKKKDMHEPTTPPIEASQVDTVSDSSQIEQSATDQEDTW